MAMDSSIGFYVESYYSVGRREGMSIHKELHAQDVKVKGKASQRDEQVVALSEKESRIFR